MREREIIIRFRLPRSPRARWLIGGATALLLTGALVYAAVPNMFNAGDPLSATKIMGNFNYLDNRITSLASATEFVVSGSLPSGAAAINPTGTGLAAHSTFTPPANGSVVVNWSLLIGLNAAPASCTIFANVGTSDKAPTGSDAYVSQIYLPTYNQYSQFQLNGTAVLPVTGGTSTTIYLNGTASCGGYYFRAPSITARFEPSVTSNITVN
jgi:hypothetical protein